MQLIHVHVVVVAERLALASTIRIVFEIVTPVCLDIAEFDQLHVHVHMYIHVHVHVHCVYTLYMYIVYIHYTCTCIYIIHYTCTCNAKYM